MGGVSSPADPFPAPSPAPDLPAAAHRALFSDRRGSGLRATWHAERDLVVVSLWHGNVCAATVQLDPAEAARLGAFLQLRPEGGG